MNILETLNLGDITYNDITYNRFYLQVTRNRYWNLCRSQMFSPSYIFPRIHILLETILSVMNVTKLFFATVIYDVAVSCSVWLESISNLV
jgi:hypothetical protein